MNFFDMDDSTSATAGDGMVSNNSMCSYLSIANKDTFIDAGGAGSVLNYGTDVAAERGTQIPILSGA